MNISATYFHEHRLALKAPKEHEGSVQTKECLHSWFCPSHTGLLPSQQFTFQTCFVVQKIFLTDYSRLWNSGDIFLLARMII